VGLSSLSGRLIAQADPGHAKTLETLLAGQCGRVLPHVSLALRERCGVSQRTKRGSLLLARSVGSVSREPCVARSNPTLPVHRRGPSRLPPRLTASPEPRCAGLRQPIRARRTGIAEHCADFRIAHPRTAHLRIRDDSLRPFRGSSLCWPASQHPKSPAADDSLDATFPRSFRARKQTRIQYQAQGGSSSVVSVEPLVGSLFDGLRMSEPVPSTPVSRETPPT